MLLKGIAVLSLLAGMVCAVIAFFNGFDLTYIALAMGGILAFAVLNALADIVDYLEIIADNAKK